MAEKATPISATLREYAAAAALAGARCNGEGFTEWGKHLLRDAELALIRADHEQQQPSQDEMDAVAEFIAEAKQSDTNRPCIDYTELQWLEGLADALQSAHADLTLLGSHNGTLQSCNCDLTAAWKKAHWVTVRVRAALGLRQRLPERV